MKRFERHAGIAGLVAAVSMFTLAGIARAAEPDPTAEVVSSDEHAHANHVAVFGGATTTLDPNHTHPTVGADYERRLPPWHGLLGVGALFDAVLGDEKEYIVAPFLAVHPFGGLKLAAAPGVVFAHDTRHFVLRGTAAYDIHVASFSLSPTVSADLIEGHVAIVYGLSVGLGF